MTNHRPQTKIFTSENIVSVFPPFPVCFHWEKQSSDSVLFGHFKVRRYSFSRGIHRRTRIWKHKKEKWAEYFYAVRIFDAKRRAVEEIPPDELNSFISEFIVTMRKKDDNENYGPSPLRGTRPALKGIWREKITAIALQKTSSLKKHDVQTKRVHLNMLKFRKCSQQAMSLLTGVDGAKVKLYFMVGSFLRLLFSCCEESLTHSLVPRSFVCDSSQLVNKAKLLVTILIIYPNQK